MLELAASGGALKTIHASFVVDLLLDAPVVKLRGMLQDDKGRPLEPLAARRELKLLRKQGVQRIPLGDPCEGFSNVTGCPGHPAPVIAGVGGGP